ncbi:circadian clock protein KaiA [Synechococcus sp. H60.2]|uniref:circadian clock protein KaiA n=1 Tax=unclassified Synechococcus TaxID=2626047 RepID=UPI0039C0D419
MKPDTHPLHISLLLDWEPPAGEPLAAEALLSPERFVAEVFQEPEAFLEALQGEENHPDCLVLLVDATRLDKLEALGCQLCKQGLLLPTVVAIVSEELKPEGGASRSGEPSSPPVPPGARALLKRERFFYHNATLVRLVSPSELLPPKGSQATPSASPSPLELLINRAIALFLQIAPTCSLPAANPYPKDQPYLLYTHQQQRRLAEKLRERLGYAGVYYHRDPELFYRHLPPDEQQALMRRLRNLYQAIVLEYFQSPETVNARIDELVALAFFADIGAAQLLELHMNLMEDFAKQLKLEGRSEEILLDYRLTLIDVMAHLSEMYRRSIPKPAPRDP